MSFEKKIEKIIFTVIKKVLLKWFFTFKFKPDKYLFFLDESEIKNNQFLESLMFETLNHQRNNFKSTPENDLILISFENYLGNVGSRINNYLRGIEMYQDQASLIKYINTISLTIDNFSVSNNLIVSRIMDSKSFEKFSSQFNMVEKGFLSTSINLNNIKNNNSEYSNIENDVLMILKVPKNSKAIYLEQCLSENYRRNEFEMLFQKGSKIKIERKFKVFSHRIIFGIIEQQ